MRFLVRFVCALSFPAWRFVFKQSGQRILLRTTLFRIEWILEAMISLMKYLTVERKEEKNHQQ